MSSRLENLLKKPLLLNGFTDSSAESDPAEFTDGTGEVGDAVETTVDFDFRFENEEVIITAKVFDLRVDPSRGSTIVIEPVMGEGGYYPAPSSFLRALRDIANDYGILLVFDEVQTGFGRTGKMFAAEHAGVTPDILVLAKALSGGMPLGAIVASRELHEKWPTAGHGSTFGGNPVSCAAALANISIIEEEKLVERSEKVGADIVKRLQHSIGHLPAIKEVRGIGMMIGIEFHVETAAAYVPVIKSKALEKRLLIMNCGVKGQTIRLMLPLNIDKDVLDQGLSLLEEAITEAVSIN